MTSVETLLTAAEYAALPDCEETRTELVRGRVVPMPRPKPIHGQVSARLAMRLGLFVEETHLGAVTVDSGYLVERSPDTLRGPDVAFISFARLGGESFGPEFVPMAPDLAVEVISPSEIATDIEDKVAQYFAAGARRVWLVWPERKQITVRRPDGTATTHGAGAVLTSDDASFDVPGFALPLASIFPA
jgi:Uma2 family endonuclease